MWQDILIALAQATFAIALVPAIFADEKPPLSTSLLTVIGMAAIGVAFFTLELWWSTAMSATQAVLWGVLAWQRRHSRAPVSHTPSPP